MAQRPQSRTSRTQQSARTRTSTRRSASRQEPYQARHSAQGSSRSQRARTQRRQTQGTLAPRRQPQRSGPGKGLAIGIVVALLICLAVGVTLYLTQCRGTQGQQATQEQAANTQDTNDGSSGSGDSGQGSGEAGDAQDDENEQAAAADSWELTLVNATHPLPEDWEIELTEVADGKYVDSRIADQFVQMIDDCRAAGYDDVYVNQAYRSHEDQQAIWDEFYGTFIAQGYSEDEAYALTLESVAIPGNSEHELGLAADICSAYFDEDYNAPIQTWLRENGYKYGFIQRYPAGKEDVTGVKNENWHFRYVGVEAATAIHESGQVLEEYLGVTD